MSDHIQEPTPEMMVEHLDGQVHTLLRENEQLRAALKPFADFNSDLWEKHILRGYTRAGQETMLMTKHFEAARKALGL